MNTLSTALASVALSAALLAGCKGPSSGPDTPAGSPGTGTNVPMNNTPGLSGTGTMAPANRGTDTRTRVGPGTDAGVTGGQVQPTPPPAARSGEPTTRPPTPQPLPRTTNPTTRPSTGPTGR